MLKVFTVYDSKVEAYMPPMFLRSTGEAIRAFTAAANDEKHNFHMYSEDFTLFELGEYDESTAEFNLLATPRSLGVAIEYVGK